MEKMNPESTDAKWTSIILDLNSVFGDDYVRLLDQISHDNPALCDKEVLLCAWSLIPEATAYMQPAHPETLLENAILIHEGYEAFRRTQKT